MVKIPSPPHTKARQERPAGFFCA